MFIQQWSEKECLLHPNNINDEQYSGLLRKTFTRPSETESEKTREKSGLK